MKHPVISIQDRRSIVGKDDRHGERGVTMVLIASAMIAIMAMAALSIDVVTLYLANAEAQRSADGAALAAARILSLSGMTGDPQNSGALWPQACTLATQVAQTVANQNLVGGAAPNSVNVTFPNDPSGTCNDGAATVFGVNPLIQVQVQRSNLPTFFARIWGRTGSNISATATAEAFNPSNSGLYAGAIVPVQPRCVKPWIVPNVDPQNAGTFVNIADGTISNPGIQLNYSGGTSGVIGERFTLASACTGVTCTNVQAVGYAGLPAGSYVPAYVESPSIAVSGGPGCAISDVYQEAIAGCDVTTVYSCGAPNGITAMADVSLNRIAETSSATQCLIQQPGQDIITTAAFPFQIQAGSSNPYQGPGLAPGQVVTNSNSIVTIPIMNGKTVPTGSMTPSVTIVGFLQAFVEQVNNVGGVQNPVVTVLNVSGCSNAASQTGVTGSSPVPVRLINYP